MHRATSEAHLLAELLESNSDTDREQLYDRLYDLQKCFNLTNDPVKFNEIYPEGNYVVIDPITESKKYKIVIVEKDD